MIQVRQSKQPATVIRLDSLFAHGDGLPCRRISTTAERLGYASTGTKAVRLEGSERYRLIATVMDW
jgi:hypothetical protein